MHKHMFIILMALDVSHSDKCLIYLCCAVIPCLLGVKNCQYIHPGDTIGNNLFNLDVVNLQ